jgi:hypothetical protein
VPSSLTVVEAASSIRGIGIIRNRGFQKLVSETPSDESRLLESQNRLSVDSDGVNITNLYI